jgi:molybdopterin/thiamine biosynthesis adenylyltransferase
MTAYVLVGAGGTGSYLFNALHRYLKSVGGEWTLHIYDGDEVQANNLERQNFEAGDLFQNKATALAKRGLDSEHLFAYPQFLGPDSLPKAIQDGDVVLIAADNMFIRARIQEHANTLENVVVINGGNEEISGSVQLWIREKGKNVTPPLSHLHNEITNTNDADRSGMSCADIAALPGGGQTVLANTTAATLMLAALWRYHQNKHKDKEAPGVIPWTEIQFDHSAGTVTPWDVRPTKGWQANT